MPMIDVETGRFTIGVFQDAEWAARGVEALKRAGILPEALSMVAKDSPAAAALIERTFGGPPSNIELAGIGAALALELAGDVGGADAFDFLAEELFDRLLDLKLVGLPVDHENDLVIGLLEKSGLFAEVDVFDDLVDIFHGLASGPGFRRCAARGC